MLDNSRLAAMRTLVADAANGYATVTSRQYAKDVGDLLEMSTALLSNLNMFTDNLRKAQNYNARLLEEIGELKKQAEVYKVQSSRYTFCETLGNYRREVGFQTLEELNAYISSIGKPKLATDGPVSNEGESTVGVGGLI